MANAIRLLRANALAQANNPVLFSFFVSLKKSKNVKEKSKN
jgi:hypothetical protein